MAPKRTLAASGAAHLPDEAGVGSAPSELTRGRPTKAIAAGPGRAEPSGRRGGADPGGVGPEDAAVERVARALESVSGPAPAGSLWIGDDAAVVPRPDGPLVLATDAVVAGVHADLGLVGLDDLGWKALTAAVSDIGAMGARPLHALVTYCLPAGTDIGLLTKGVAEASARWACPVVGGDLTSSGQVMVSVAVTGVLDGELPAVRRGGASSGDRLFVTGPLGASAAGLRVLSAPGAGAPGARTEGATAGASQPDPAVAEVVHAHRRPVARLAEGQVARRAGATAMIDVSDGLAVDLHRLADASGVGFQLESVPVAPAATEDEALSGGEDYELVIASPDPDRLVEAFRTAGLRPPLPVGRCTADPDDRRFRGERLGRRGWQHPVG